MGHSIAKPTAARWCRKVRALGLVQRPTLSTRGLHLGIDLFHGYGRDAGGGDTLRNRQQRIFRLAPTQCLIEQLVRNIFKNLSNFTVTKACFLWSDPFQNIFGRPVADQLKTGQVPVA